MTLPKSHKNPAAYSEHEQTRTHAPVSKAAYGVDTSNHPSRRGWEAMDRHEAQLQSIAAAQLETENSREAVRGLTPPPPPRPIVTKGGPLPPPR